MDQSATNPLLMDVPSELMSARLLLRAPRAGDGQIVHPTAIESLGQLKPWMVWAVDNYSIENAEEWCRKSAVSWLKRDHFQFLFFLRDGLHLGTMGVFNIDWKIRKCEIGYWLRASHTGRGLMSEAVSTVMAFARDTLHMQRIEIRTDSNNVKSRAVAVRLGYQLEGILRRDSLSPAGAMRDTCVYSEIFMDA
jgi:RimJ/RimL family protein N-acetyltransferase